MEFEKSEKVVRSGFRVGRDPACLRHSQSGYKGQWVEHE
jgi:hypothetical protein